MSTERRAWQVSDPPFFRGDQEQARARVRVARRFQTPHFSGGGSGAIVVALWSAKLVSDPPFFRGDQELIDGAGYGHG